MPFSVRITVIGVQTKRAWVLTRDHWLMTRHLIADIDNVGGLDPAAGAPRSPDARSVGAAGPVPVRQVRHGRISRGSSAICLTAILPMRHTRSVTTLFDVVAEPHRRRMLDLLRDGDRLAGRPRRPRTSRQPTVSKHLRRCATPGWSTVRPDAHRRWYRLRPEPLRRARRLAGALPPAWAGAPGRPREPPRRRGGPMTGDPTADPMAGSLRDGGRVGLRFRPGPPPPRRRSGAR